MEQSLTRGCCDDPCSQEAARTCLCSIPALFPLGPSDRRQRSGTAVPLFFSKDRVRKRTHRHPKLLGFRLHFLCRGTARCISLCFVASFTGRRVLQVFVQTETEAQSNKYTIEKIQFAQPGPGTFVAVWTTGRSPGDDPPCDCRAEAASMANTVPIGKQARWLA